MAQRHLHLWAVTDQHQASQAHLSHTPVAVADQTLIQVQAQAAQAAAVRVQAPMERRQPARQILAAVAVAFGMRHQQLVQAVLGLSF